MRTCSSKRTRPCIGSIPRISKRGRRGYDIRPSLRQRIQTLASARVACVLNRWRRRHNSRATGVGHLGNPLRWRVPQVGRGSNCGTTRQRQPARCSLINLGRRGYHAGRSAQCVPPQVRCSREWHQRGNVTRAGQIRRPGRSLPDVGGCDDARLWLRGHWHRRLMGRLLCVSHFRPCRDARCSAPSRRKGSSGWIVGDRLVDYTPLWKQLDRCPYSGLAPHEQNNQQQMP